MRQKFFGVLVIACLLFFSSCASPGVKKESALSSENRGSFAAEADGIENLPPLKDAYEDYFRIGSFVADVYLSGNARQILLRHFYQATIGNSLKPESVQPEKGQWVFETPDRIINDVLQQGFEVHGHTLAWHEQSPKWINRPGIGREEARENLVTHVQTVMEHFKGRLVSWDVLNEAMADNPPNPEDWRASLRKTPWLDALGPEYVELLFRTAREADPGVRLYYNDYNLDNPAKARAVYNMVEELNRITVEDRPLVDGIGMQSHYHLDTSLADVENSLKLFISLGVEISISELDIQVGENGVLTGEEAARQGKKYAELFRLYKQYSAHIYRVTTCGMEDSTSWRSRRSPLLFDGSLKAKPAYHGALNPDAYLAGNSN
jgi:endo-1,4-beta-xylanase